MMGTVDRQVRGEAREPTFRSSSVDSSVLFEFWRPAAGQGGSFISPFVHSLAQVRNGLVEAAAHLVNREYTLLAADFTALGLLPEGASDAQKERIANALVSVFQGALEKASGSSL